MFSAPESKSYTKSIHVAFVVIVPILGSVEFSAGGMFGVDVRLRYHAFLIRKVYHVIATTESVLHQFDF